MPLRHDFVPQTQLSSILIYWNGRLTYFYKWRGQHCLPSSSIIPSRRKNDIWHAKWSRSAQAPGALNIYQGCKSGLCQEVLPWTVPSYHKLRVFKWPARFKDLLFSYINTLAAWSNTQSVWRYVVGMSVYSKGSRDLVLLFVKNEPIKVMASS